MFARGFANALRLSLGEVVAELIRVYLPGLDEDAVADIMEEVLPTPEDRPLQVDHEELQAVLQGDACIFKERQDAATIPPAGPKEMEQDIAEHVAKLQQRAQHKRNTLKGEPPSERPAPTAATASADAWAAVLPAQIPTQHWSGKGGAWWTAEA